SDSMMPILACFSPEHLYSLHNWDAPKLSSPINPEYKGWFTIDVESRAVHGRKPPRNRLLN
ncbi:hypothetical protein, partial [Spirulina sp.]|uniref:hypothetical protein n=1 Tax=Spirulina sp. TaxID=1157 RepID=UPI003F71FA2F